MLFGQDVPGYPSLIVGLMVIGGVQLLMIGVLGEYIGKLLSEIKARPVYFVAEHSLKSARAPAKEVLERRQGQREAALAGRARGGVGATWPTVVAASGCAPTITAFL